MDVKTHIENLKEKLKNMNYPVDLIERKFKEAKQSNRKNLISGSRKSRIKNDNMIRPIFTHNEGNPPIHHWLREKTFNKI